MITQSFAFYFEGGCLVFWSCRQVRKFFMLVQFFVYMSSLRMLHNQFLSSFSFVPSLFLMPLEASERILYFAAPRLVQPNKQQRVCGGHHKAHP